MEASVFMYVLEKIRLCEHSWISVHKAWLAQAPAENAVARSTHHGESLTRYARPTWSDTQPRIISAV